MSIQPLIDRQVQAVVELRHRLHQIPELGYQEFETAQTIRTELNRLGIPFRAGVEGAPTATVAIIGDQAKPCIALRADIDALPIKERTALPYASRRDGLMHACGHDGHTATLIGAAAVLKQIESDLPVCVKLLWQPAEEGGAGASKLVEAGVLDGRIGPKVQAIFGLHGWPGLRLGTVATRPGPLLAATDNFEANFIGRGCHGAFPHLGRDPIPTACEAVVNLQQFVSRELDPAESVVVTVGMIQSGTAVNVIPDTAVIRGTARTLNHVSRTAAAQAIRRRCAGIAQANDCELRFEWSEGYPVTQNDPASADYVAALARETFGAERFIPVARPSMGGEDFAYYLQHVPGCFFFVGVIPPDRTDYPPLHSDLYDFTDGALPVGMRMFVEVARRFEAPVDAK